MAGKVRRKASQRWRIGSADCTADKRIDRLLNSMTSSVDEFENAFQSCITALTSPTTNYPHDTEEVKTSADQTVQRVLDSAKAMECFFLQKRLYLSVHRPEQLIKEEIDEIKIEIQRKDAVISKFQEKLQLWQGMLSDQPQAAVPMSGIPAPGHPLAPTNSHPMIQQHLQQGHQSPALVPMGMRPPHPGQQMMNQMAPGPPHAVQQQQVLPPQAQMAQVQQHGHILPPHAMQPGLRMQQQQAQQQQQPPPHMLAARGQMMQSGYGANAAPPQHHFMQSQMPPQQQQQQQMPQVMPQQQHQQQAQQSPLAFLERTTSSIGLPDTRR